MCEIRLVATLASRKNCHRGDIKVLPAPSRIFVERFPRVKVDPGTEF